MSKSVLVGKLLATRVVGVSKQYPSLTRQMESHPSNESKITAMAISNTAAEENTKIYRTKVYWKLNDLRKGLIGD